MKKTIVILCIAILSIVSLFASGAEEKKNPTVATTIFPIYDWTREILGENPAGIELIMLLDKGTDLHSYQPTPEDIVRISSADLFIYVGGESDEWAEDILSSPQAKNLKSMKLLEALGDGAKEEVILEGMEHDHDHEDHDHEDHEHEHEIDEHVWLSLRNASVLCNAIRDRLIEIDPENGKVYTENCRKYIERLEALDESYIAEVQKAGQKVLLFADRFPFRYLADDYGLTCYAAFSGCSAETEASFETVAFLVGKVDELKLAHIMVIENNDGKMANTIIRNSRMKDQDILALDSLQSTTRKDVDNGKTYIKTMERNLEVLLSALK